MVETTELLKVLEVMITVMGVLTIILGVLEIGIILIFRNWRQKMTHKEFAVTVDTLTETNLDIVIKVF